MLVKITKMFSFENTQFARNRFYTDNVKTWTKSVNSDKKIGYDKFFGMVVIEVSRNVKIK